MKKSVQQQVAGFLDLYIRGGSPEEQAEAVELQRKLCVEFEFARPQSPRTGKKGGRK